MASAIHQHVSVENLNIFCQTHHVRIVGADIEPETRAVMLITTTEGEREDAPPNLIISLVRNRASGKHDDIRLSKIEFPS